MAKVALLLTGHNTVGNDWFGLHWTSQTAGRHRRWWGIDPRPQGQGVHNHAMHRLQVLLQVLLAFGSIVTDLTNPRPHVWVNSLVVDQTVLECCLEVAEVTAEHFGTVFIAARHGEDQGQVIIVIVLTKIGKPGSWHWVELSQVWVLCSEWFILTTLVQFILWLMAWRGSATVIQLLLGMATFLFCIARLRLFWSPGCRICWCAFCHLNWNISDTFWCRTWKKCTQRLYMFQT